MRQTELRYPRKSHRKEVSIPCRSEKLAEFVGIMLGDGGIKNPYQADISMNSVADAAYARYVEKLIIYLFEVRPVIRIRSDSKTLIISMASINIIDFLISLGIPRGNKLKAGLKIPEWILKSHSFSVACVRGLMDTDGCLYIHNHKVGEGKYRNIGLCFSSYSPPLLKQMAVLFGQSGITPHISSRGRDIYLYRIDAIERYLTVFGTSNQRIESVYRTWRGARAV